MCGNSTSYLKLLWTTNKQSPLKNIYAKQTHSHSLSDRISTLCSQPRLVFSTPSSWVWGLLACATSPGISQQFSINRISFSEVVLNSVKDLKCFYFHAIETYLLSVITKCLEMEHIILDIWKALSLGKLTCIYKCIVLSAKHTLGPVLSDSVWSQSTICWLMCEPQNIKQEIIKILWASSLLDCSWNPVYPKAYI